MNQRHRALRPHDTGRTTRAVETDQGSFPERLESPMERRAPGSGPIDRTGSATQNHGARMPLGAQELAWTKRADEGGLCGRGCRASVMWRLGPGAHLRLDAPTPHITLRGESARTTCGGSWRVDCSRRSVRGGVRMNACCRSDVSGGSCEVATQRRLAAPALEKASRAARGVPRADGDRNGVVTWRPSALS
jgi:hypothetical protein